MYWAVWHGAVAATVAGAVEPVFARPSMNSLQLLFYISSVILMIIIPGPVLLLVVGTGLQAGYKKAFQTIAGTNAASLVLILISALILKGFISLHASVLDLLKCFGSLYILYLGGQLIRDSRQTHQAEFHSLSPRLGGMRKGFLVGISNPKDILFFSAFFPQFIQVLPNVNQSLILLTLVWIMLDFATLSLAYLLFKRMVRSFAYQRILLMCGILLSIIAVYGMYSGLFDLFSG